MADLVTILETLSQSLPSVQRMVVAFAYLAGFTMIFMATYKLKQYGELRAMMSLQTDFRGPVTTIFVGAILIYLPNAYEIMMNSFFGYGSALSYQVENDNRWSEVVSVVIYFTQIIGIISFIRGWILVSRSANSQGQQNQMQKGLIHIIGGLMAINIVGMVELVNATLGTDIGFSPSLSIP